jgi:hypothetical protein
MSRAYRKSCSPPWGDRVTATLAARQHGIVRVDQLYAAGLHKDAVARRVAAGRLHRLYPRVYAVGHLALTPHSHRLAAVYAYWPGAVLSHRSAAALWGLLRHASRIEVTAPRACRPGPGVVLHRSRLIHDDDRAVIDGIPVTSVARTIVDLADGPERYLAAAVREAEVRKLFDLWAIDRTLERLPGRRGQRMLRRVVAAYRPESALTRSGAERRFLDICRDRGLPIPQVNILDRRVRGRLLLAGCPTRGRARQPHLSYDHTRLPCRPAAGPGAGHPGHPGRARSARRPRAAGGAGAATSANPRPPNGGLTVDPMVP